jgi:hypothetical protein
MQRRRLLSALCGIAVTSQPWRAEGQAPDAHAFGIAVARAAEARTRMAETYDPAYRVIAYPMGDVPDDRGVCTDTVIRAFRAGGVDLQALVHADMRRAFAAYPPLWGLARPDRNIDHRRVPNLETFFTRAGARLGTPRGPDAMAGDVVSWRLTGSGLAHIGVALEARGSHGGPLIAHNIGRGSEIEDVLFAWPIVGWFRYRPTLGG